MGGRGGSGADKGAGSRRGSAGAQVSPPKNLEQPSLRDRILAAYRDLATRPGGPVSLEKLREYLNADRKEIDRTLVEMDDLREIHLEPDPDRRGLTAEARKSAVNLAGRPMHLLRVRHIEG